MDPFRIHCSAQISLICTSFRNDNFAYWPTLINFLCSGLPVAASLRQPEAGVRLRARPSHHCHTKNIKT